MGLKLYKTWTLEEDNCLRALLNNNQLSYWDIAKQLRRSANSCQSRAHYLNLSSNFVNRQYSFNENFWKTPNPINSYWAGFVAADGSLTSDKFIFKLAISKNDISQLERFKNDCDAEYNILSQTRMTKKGNKSEMVSIAINGCPTWYEDLKTNFNITPNKTHRLQPPNLLDNYLKLCYLIGYTDGDGTICLNCRNEVTIGYASASQSIIDWVKDTIETNFPLKLCYKPANVRVKPTHSLFAVNGIRSFIILDALKDFPVPKLARKWHQPKVLELLESYKDTYLDLFWPIKIPPEWRDFSLNTEKEEIFPTYQKIV